MHSKLQKLFEYLWPELILKGTPWYDAWYLEHSRQFANRGKIFFVLVAVGYVGHYYYVDIPNNKEPIESWFFFRMSMAGLSLSTAAVLFSDAFVASRFVKWPAILFCIAACVTQGYVPVYFPEAPWFYPYLFLFTSVLVLSTSPIKSLIFAIPTIVLFYPALLDSGAPGYQLASASVVSVIVILGIRGSYISEIRTYALTRERDAFREEVIQLGKEYESRLKSFIPRVIAERLENLIENTKLSVLEATLNVLTPKKQVVACLWSDIRGFTQGSRDIDRFLADSVLPEVKLCSDAVENHEGIPRKIGDLIFAYFDGDDKHINLLRSILAGFALSELNKDMNATVSTMDVNRFILISVGEALVGNVGGMNSGVEITALGPPVNFLARLDDATKAPGLAKHLKPGDILLCADSAKTLNELDLGIDCFRVCLKREKVEIRDFPEAKEVFVLRPSSESHELLELAYKTAA
ncbi:MAG: hypothetical protein AAF541_13615 [Pseudomonadota bacterium]